MENQAVTHPELLSLLNELKTSNTDKYLIMFSLPNCPPCNVYKSMLRTQTEPDRWKIAEFQDVTAERWMAAKLPNRVPIFFVYMNEEWKQQDGNKAMWLINNDKADVL